MVLAAKCSEEAERAYFEAEIRPRLGDDVELIEDADAERTNEILLHARCTLFPIQWREPFGMVMIESMVCGTPVVALRNGSVPEVIEDGATGLVLDTDDPAAIAEAVARLLADDEAREALSRESRSRTDRFSASAAAAVYAERLTAALAKR